MDKVQLAGFAVRGFRSFYALQHVRLDTKITALAGVNNSGKSNVLHAAAKILNGYEPGLNRSTSIDPLDQCDIEDGAEPIPLTIGVGIPIKQSVTDSLLDSFDPRGRRPHAHSEEYKQLTKLAEAIYASSEQDDDLVWLYATRTGDTFSVDREQVQSVALNYESGGNPGLLQKLTGNMFSSSTNDPRANIEQWIRHWSTSVSIPRVTFIPHHRQIINNGNVTSDFSSTSGVGFTGLLKALQAPSAHTYRRDRSKFMRINQFVKDVLEDETAEILVPYDNSTVHVSIDGRVLPLANLGAGIEQMVILGALATHHDGDLMCIEEPELHLHPTLLRKLVTYLEATTRSRYLLSTHSAQLMDQASVAILGTTHSAEHGTEVRQLITRANRAELSSRLGYRASDIVQSNCVIWVEGPSDRIYVRAWVKATSPRLIEGVHYSILPYGGKLLSHLSGEESEFIDGADEDFISLIEINRHMAVLIDSDKRSPDAGINATKTRIIEEFENSGGLSWVTAGREVENYIDHSTFFKAVQAVHPRANPPKERSSGPFASRFSFVKASGQLPGGKVRQANKVAIAEHVTAIKAYDPSMLDLEEKVSALVAFVEAANL